MMRRCILNLPVPTGNGEAGEGRRMEDSTRKHLGHEHHHAHEHNHERAGPDDETATPSCHAEATARPAPADARGSPRDGTQMKWTCPMHPEVVRDEPGSCPICGMALEPMTVTEEEPENEELRDMTRRFWVSAALALPLFIIEMAAMFRGMPTSGGAGQLAMPAEAAHSPVIGWIGLALATPVVLWGAWPFFVRGWQSLVTRNLNMFTLIALGVAAAYLYS